MLACRLVVLVICGDILVVASLLVLHFEAVLVFSGEF